MAPTENMRRKIFELAHEGHLGQTLTKQRVREHFWWPAMDKFVPRLRSVWCVWKGKRG